MTPFDRREGKIRLRDGRTLAYVELGPRGGAPVVYLHGFPGCAVEAELFAPAAAVNGVRLIAPDRPGYGGSDRCTARTLVGSVDDLEQLVDSLGVDRFGLVGVSGGGPSAVAVAHGLGRRVTRLGLVCALGPVHEPIQRRDMLAIMRFGLWLAARSRPLARALWWFVSLPTRVAPRACVRLGRRFMPNPADRRALSAHHDVFDREMIGAFRQGGIGGFDDLMTYARSWGFRLEDVAVEAFCWHAEADRIVPIACAHAYVERLPRCTALLRPDGGHQSLAIDAADEVVAVVGGGQVPAGAST